MSQGLSRTESFVAGMILTRFDVTAIPWTPLRALITRTAPILQRSFPDQALCSRPEYLVMPLSLSLEGATDDISALLVPPDLLAA